MAARFFTITYQYTPEFAADSVARAGGKGTESEIADIIAESRFRQRVHEASACDHIAGMSHHGYAVVDVAYAVPPVA